MSPPAVVYVVAAVFGVAAVFAFKEFVYEPHIAPKVEAWAEDFLERRRAHRNRRASAIPVRTSRRRNSPPSSVSSHQDDDPQGDRPDGERAHGPNNLDAFELEAITSREVDEWRNEVLRSQEVDKDGLRKRRMSRIRDEFEGYDSMSTTLDESFTSLTHTPLASTHVISNLSSPVTHSTTSLPQTPTRRPRSESQSTAQDVRASFVAPYSPPSPIFERPVAFGGYAILTPRPPVDGASHDTTTSSPHAIPIADRRSPLPHPLPFTPTYQATADDSPFGPLLPDTPRSSAEIYGERPFSPLSRVVESSSSSITSIGSKGTLSSRAASTRTLGSSAVLRQPSRLANEVVNSSGDGNDEEESSHASFAFENAGLVTNGSVISSLSERYPAPPTPPVVLSPPASSVDILSVPSSPRSGGSEVIVHQDALPAVFDVSAPSCPQTHPSVPTLQLPPDASSPRLTSRSQSSAQSAPSPALSFASFLSPMPMRHAVSESEGDEFMSVASYDSDWSVSSPVTPGQVNPFLDVEHLARTGRWEIEGESEGSEVFVSEVGQEGESEVGSDESWGSARGH